MAIKGTRKAVLSALAAIGGEHEIDRDSWGEPTLIITAPSGAKWACIEAHDSYYTGPSMAGLWADAARDMDEGTIPCSCC